MTKLIQKVLFAAVILTLALGLLAAPAVVTPAAAGANTPLSSQLAVDPFPGKFNPADLFPDKAVPPVLPCGYTWAG